MNEKIYYFLKKILEIRFTENFIADQFIKNKIFAFLHLCIGQEASAVGVCSALDNNDQVWGNHRSHGHYLAKGGNYEKMVLEIFGDIRGCCKGYGGSMHLIDRSVGFMGSGPILGSCAPISAGLAAAKKFSDKKGIVVCFLGDGSSEEGAFYETLNLVGVLKLPILFVIEDNIYSVETDSSSRKVKGYNHKNIFHEGLKAHYQRVFGQDVLKVFEATKEAKKKIIEEDTPSVLHLDVLRTYKHSGAQPESENAYYRKIDNKEFHKDNDCIEIIKKKLYELGEQSDFVENFINMEKKEIEEKFNKIINRIKIRK